MTKEEVEEKPQEEKKTRRPKDGAFRQQRLPAWQPVLTPRTVLPTLFLVGIIFCPAGGLLWWNSNKVIFEYQENNEYLILIKKIQLP
jgi:hypothetical protein